MDDLYKAIEEEEKRKKAQFELQASLDGQYNEMGEALLYNMERQKSRKSRKSGKSGKSGKSVESETSDDSGKSVDSGKSGKSVKSGKSGKSGKSRQYKKDQTRTRNKDRHLKEAAAGTTVLPMNIILSRYTTESICKSTEREGVYWVDIKCGNYTIPDNICSENWEDGVFGEDEWRDGEDEWGNDKWCIISTCEVCGRRERVNVDAI